MGHMASDILTIGDDTTDEIVSQGDACISLNDGQVRVTSNVLYVPGIRTNLFSAKQLDTAGGEIFINVGTCILRNSSGLVIATCTLDTYLYKLGMTYRQQEKVSISLNISSLNLANLWHQRLGHINKRRLHEVQIASKGIGCFDASGLSLCTCCLKGKQHKVKFSKVGATRAQELLGIIHSDICGPLRTSTFSECMYFLTFIDDKSRYTKVYLLTHKSKDLQKFQEYNLKWKTKPTRRSKF